MKKLTVQLENCYGIRKLDSAFDFTDQNVYAIYAPNGAMKSSFAQTFRDTSEGTPSRDRIFPDRPCSRKIVDENGQDLPQDSILVVRPYDEEVGHTEKTSTLLVNAPLRKEYEQLHVELDKAKEALLKALKARSGSKKDLESEISGAFTKSPHEFYRALVRIRDEVDSQKDAPFGDVRYDTIFDDKVLSFLGTKDFKTAIEAYVRKYNELLAASTYFRKGTFNYYNAATIAKNLADNGFFEAKHTVRLNGDKPVDINSQAQLEEVITKEKEGISKDKDLRKKFADIEKLITKNVNVREFEAYLAENEALLPKLANLDSFKEEIWKSYLKKDIDLYHDVVLKYQAAEKRRAAIEQEANKQRTQWERVIDIFNDRFFVPFKLTATNRTSVILGEQSLLSLGFTFEDGGGTAPVAKGTLIQSLSTGEKKALYILNIIFEVEVRRQAKQETLFIVDDIADSFDYKNKYAIIQYLQDIAEQPHFRQIILTHNFDFFRTVHSRSLARYNNCLMAAKSSSGLVLQPATGIKNIFVNDWKSNFFIDPRKRIACIPFIRNIIEYTKGEADPDFVKLTSLLHWKTDSGAITQHDLDLIYTRIFAPLGDSKVDSTINGTAQVTESIFEEARYCLKASEGINFEHKIVLSIAIRIAAERFMVSKINDSAFVAAISSNQTVRLLAKFKALFSGDSTAINTILRVVLMTPENIHLNSFMYEPILDMSDEHLRKLYTDVLHLDSALPVMTQGEP